jgi:putative acetyltransferase
MLTGSLPARPVKLSPPTPEDQSDIERLFISAFSHAEGPAEGELIGGLVRDLLGSTAKEDLHCFVAREETGIVGSIVFSRLRFETGIQAFLLAPVAVAPECQGRGIGQELIAFELDALCQCGVELVITYGDPAFYAKVGFQPVSQAVIPAPRPLQQPHGWQAQSLCAEPIQPIQGRCTCVEALNRPEYW